MHSEEKRGLFSNYLSSKVTTETEYEMRLRIIKDKQEERLEALTDKIRVIYEDVRRDEVIVTMRSDPASSAFVSHRMKEICEDHLAKEREETIDRLTEDVALSQTELKRIEKEMKEVRSNLELAQESFQNDRAKIASLEQENRTIRARLSGLRQDEPRSRDTDRGKEQLERELWEKRGENEALVREIEKGRVKLAEITEDSRKLREELKDRERVTRENLELLSALKEELSLIKREKEDLNIKQGNYGQQFKDIYETEEKSHNNALIELNTTYKEKSNRFKKKIIEQKKIINVLENELTVAREVAETCKLGQERSLLIAQEDLKKVKDQWERKCKDMEKENFSHLSEIQAKHQAQITDLQRHYQELLEERIKDFQGEQSSQLSRQRALDNELKRLMDDKITQIEKDYITISKHENVLNEETSKLRIKHLQEIRQTEELLNKENSARIKDIKEQCQAELEKLEQKLAVLENDRVDILSNKRSAEVDLQFAKEHIEALNSKVVELKKQISEGESSRKELQRRIDESLNSSLRLKSQLDDELTRKKQLESEVEAIKEKTNILQSSLRDTEKEFTFKQQNADLSYQEQISGYEEALQKEQQKARRILSDLEHYQSLCQRLEKELDDLKDLQSKESQDFFNSSQRIKQEEALRYEREVESHLETKRLLIQAEHKAKFLASELETNEKLANELRLLTNKYEKEISELRRVISSLESSLAQSEKLILKLKKDQESSHEEDSSVRILNKQALKESLDRIKDRD